MDPQYILGYQREESIKQGRQSLFPEWYKNLILGIAFAAEVGIIANDFVIPVLRTRPPAIMKQDRALQNKANVMCPHYNTSCFKEKADSALELIALRESQAYVTAKNAYETEQRRQSELPKHTTEAAIISALAIGIILSDMKTPKK